jgi:type VI secretion system Hcp family effector
MKPALAAALAGAFALALGLSAAHPADAAAFIKFDGIDGESQDAAHQGWIKLQSATQLPPSTGQASGQAKGKRQHKPVTITKELDKASPKLREALAKGTVFPKVEIDYQEGEGARASYVHYELQDVIITSFQGSGSAASDGSVPTETLSLNFEKISWKNEGAENKLKQKDEPNRR